MVCIVALKPGDGRETLSQLRNRRRPPQAKERKDAEQNMVHPEPRLRY
jgi:hypothetical protein